MSRINHDINQYEREASDIQDTLTRLKKFSYDLKKFGDLKENKQINFHGIYFLNLNIYY